VTLRLDDRLRLAQSLYAQPRIDDPRDIRLLDETELLLSLDQRFMLELTFSMGSKRSRPGDAGRSIRRRGPASRCGSEAEQESARALRESLHGSIH
jgi:hypothetical protein